MLINSSLLLPGDKVSQLRRKNWQKQGKFFSGSGPAFTDLLKLCQTTTTTQILLFALLLCVGNLEILVLLVCFIYKLQTGANSLFRRGGSWPLSLRQEGQLAGAELGTQPRG